MLFENFIDLHIYDCNIINDGNYFFKSVLYGNIKSKNWNITQNNIDITIINIETINGALTIDDEKETLLYNSNINW